MKRDRFESWLRNIYETREEEIYCTECFDLMSGFVELEISGQATAAKMPQVEQHLNQCRACRDEHETLHDLRLLEEKSGILPFDDLQDLFK